MDDADKEALEDATALAAKLRVLLEATPQFQRWTQAEKLVAALRGAEEPREGTTMYWLTRNHNAHRTPRLRMPNVSYGGGEAQPLNLKKLSQADAAELALIKARRPLSTNDMIIAIKNEGAHVGGADPAVNVSSTLSKDDRFKSLRWAGGSVWWLANTPLPNSPEFEAMIAEGGNLDFGGSTDDDPSAADHQQ